MIYVIERADGGGAKRLSKRPSVAAYATHDAAERAARALGGRVRAYAVAGAESGSAEVLGREYADAAAERDALRAEIADQRAGHASLRARYGAREDETMGQWIARLHRGYRSLMTIRAELAGPGVLRGDAEDGEP
jgi:hypothetical protein